MAALVDIGEGPPPQHFFLWWLPFVYYIGGRLFLLLTDLPPSPTCLLTLTCDARPPNDRHESCGQCTPCREGTGWLETILERMEVGKVGKQEQRQSTAV